MCSISGWLVCRYSHPISSAGRAVWFLWLKAATLHDLFTAAADGTTGSTTGLGLLALWPTCSCSIGVGDMATAALVVILLVVVLGVAAGLRDRLGVLLVLVDGPIEDVVVLERLADEQITEDLAEVRVVGLVVKAERTGVVQVDGELVREPTAKDLCGSGHLFLHDAVVLLLLGGRLQTLPGERTTAEVEHDISEGFHVITTGLLDSEMGVDTGIPGSTSQVLILAVRDVEVGLGVTVFLREAKIDDVNLVPTLSNAHQEVVRFDVTMDEGLGVDVLDARYQLVGQQQDRLERKFAVAKIK